MLKKKFLFVICRCGNNENDFDNSGGNKGNSSAVCCYIDTGICFHCGVLL